MLGAEVIGAVVDDCLGVLDARIGAANFLVEAALFVGLVVAFDSLGFVQLLEASNFAPHFGTLHLDALDFAFEVVLLLVEVCNLVSLRNSLITETASLKVFFVQNFLAAVSFLIQIHVLARLFLEQVLEVV